MRERESKPLMVEAKSDVLFFVILLAAIAIIFFAIFSVRPSSQNKIILNESRIPSQNIEVGNILKETTLLIVGR